MVVPHSGSPVGPESGSALGLQEGMVVQELGWDDDVDQNLRDDIMDAIDAELIEDDGGGGFAAVCVAGRCRLAVAPG